MIILHAGMQREQLVLWGEVPADGKTPISRPRGSKARAQRTSPWPYDAGKTGLLAALGEIFSGLTIAADETETTHLWLPTVEGQAQASSPLIAEPAEPVGTKATPVLVAWTVTTLPLAIAEAVELLGLCSGQTTLAPGVIVGTDLAYWATALRFAGALVARQQFLPGVQESGGQYYARWEPVFAGAEAQRLVQLAQAMPPACRALGESKAAPTSPPAVPAQTLLTAWLGQLTDYLVRATHDDRTTVSPRKKTKAAFDSLHEQWLHALQAAEGALSITASEFQQLATQIRDWQRPIAISTAAPFRLCFRLEEPVAETEENAAAPRRRATAAKPDWYVRYLLQAADEQSLLLPVADAWNPQGRQAKPLQQALQRGSFNPREYLLSSLGQAAKVVPPIDQSLKAATPGGYELNAAGALEFLTEQAWVLEQSGFGVMLPAWWSRKGTKLSLSARARVKSPKFQGSGGLSLSEVVQFDWELALGEQTLTRQELEALAQLKAPLVKIRGQWVQLNAEEIQTALDFWKKKATTKATVRELVQMSLGAGQAPGGIPVTGVQATGWIGDFLAQLEGSRSFAELPQPESFHGTLRPYQLRGYSWLAFLRQWGLGACLADDMGLGKTPQTLALIERDWQANGKRPVLLICPMSVVGNWQKEAARFTPDLLVMIHHGLGRTKGAAFKKQAEQHALILSSYSLLHRDQKLFDEVNWAGVILDEAQNIKNAETK